MKSSEKINLLKKIDQALRNLSHNMTAFNPMKETLNKEKCPKCNSTNTDSDSHLEPDSMIYWHMDFCLDCGHRWNIE